MKKSKKTVISGLLAASLATASVCAAGPFSDREGSVSLASAGPAPAQASITEEITAKRAKFVKQFAMTDGSYTAATYSMPVHYKTSSKNGRWKEIDTTLVKSGNKDLKKTVQVLRITKPKPRSFPSKYPKRRTRNPSYP